VSFSDPLWLPAGLAACLCLLLIWRRYDLRQHAALARFISPHLRDQLTQSVSIGRRRLQRGLTLAALALLFVALAGPQIGYYWEIVHRRGNEIIFALDTSRSMSTPDIKPDRLTRAKLAIDDFTRELDGDGVGLVAFAGDAYVVCPITLDYGAFHESLAAVDTHTIPRGGTDISSAIKEAQAALQRRPGSDKILILVTDGENLEGDALNTAKAAAQRGLKIYTVGVGTAQGELIPLPGGHGFLKDDAGNYVKSHLDEPALQAIAAATGGMYAPLGPEGQGLETIYKARLAPMLKHDLASRRQKVPIQRYQWPLTASLALLLTSLLIGTRRRVRARRRKPADEPRPTPSMATAPLLSPSAATTPRLSPSVANTPRQTSATLALLMGVLMLLSLSAAPTRASTTSADEAYKRGDYAVAAKEYAAAAQQDPQKPSLAYNAGTAAYRAGEYQQAAQAFQQSISRAPSGDTKRLADQQDAYYNLGNTLYRTGQKTEEKSPQQTIETWTQAVKAYDTALQLRADDADSKYNRDFVKRKLDALKKQQQQNPQQSPQKNQQNQQQKQQQGQGQQGQQPPQNQQPPQGQPPSQNQPPQGQQPPQNPPPQGQQPPQNQQQGQPPSQNPPPGAPQNPPDAPPPNGGTPPQAQQPPPDAGNPKSGDGSPKPGEGQPQAAADEAKDDAHSDDSQRVPGQMSREEARELLDSQKGDERRALGLPMARKDAGAPPPDKPFKDW
jgi:Ca-activated chloride channel family protein